MTTNLLKKLEEKEFVFLGNQTIEGISQKNNKPYKINNVTFADPTTFENHILSHKDGLNLTFLSKGERVTLVLDLIPGFAGRNSNVQVIDVRPVK